MHPINTALLSMFIKYITNKLNLLNLIWINDFLSFSYMDVKICAYVDNII